MFAIFWLIILILLLILEASTVTLVSLWFAAGALVALVASLLNAPPVLQAILFILVSTASLAGLRPIVRKYLRPRMTKTNVDSVIGAKGYVTADVDNLSATGTVKLGGMEWSARSVSGEPIKAGTLVQVDRIEGVKVFVSPVNVTAEL